MRQVWKVCASRSEARAKGVGASLRNGIPDWTIPRTAPPQRSCMCAGPAPPRRAMAAPARSSGFRERESRCRAFYKGGVRSRCTCVQAEDHSATEISLAPSSPLSSLPESRAVPSVTSRHGKNHSVRSRRRGGARLRRRHAGPRRRAGPRAGAHKRR